MDEDRKPCPHGFVREVECADCRRVRALAWSRRVADTGGHVMHMETLTVGRVEQRWSGDDEDAYQDPAGNRVTWPVVRLSSGDCLLAHPDAFVELSAKEAGVWGTMTTTLTNWTVAAAQLAFNAGLPPPTAVLLIQATLRAHARALDSDLPNDARGPTS